MCYAFHLINIEAIKYRNQLKCNAALEAQNIAAIRNAMIEIETMIRNGEEGKYELPAA